MRQSQRHTRYQEGIIGFKTEYRRNQAYEALRQTTEKVDGNKLYVTKISDGK